MCQIPDPLARWLRQEDRTRRGGLKWLSDLEAVPLAEPRQSSRSVSSEYECCVVSAEPEGCAHRNFHGCASGGFGYDVEV